jgi:hypothetical protein
MEERRRQQLLQEGRERLRGVSDAGEQRRNEDLLLRGSDRFNDRYPHAVAYEWEREDGHPNSGRGDLVFASDDVQDQLRRGEPVPKETRFLVLEGKQLNQGTGHTAREARRQARRDARDSAERYRESFADKHNLSRDQVDSTHVLYGKDQNHDEWGPLPESKRQQQGRAEAEARGGSWLGTFFAVAAAVGAGISLAAAAANQQKERRGDRR